MLFQINTDQHDMGEEAANQKDKNRLLWEIKDIKGKLNTEGALKKKKKKG